MLTYVRKKAARVRELGLRKTGQRLRQRIEKKLGVFPSVPPTVFVEVTNNCNLDCVMCDRASLKRKTGFMSMELYRKIIDNASRIGAPEVKLNRFGEPFLHPSLAEMVRYAKSKGIPRVYFTSNATLLNEKNARLILESGLDGIAFSIDGADRETYQSIRKTDFDVVTANVERFCRMKKEMGLTKPRVQINTILLDKTKDQMKGIFERWTPLVDHINVLPVATYGNVPDLKANRPDQNLRRACDHPFDRLMVFWNGEVTVCCGDINGALKIGTVQESTLEELWKNKQIRQLRRLHKAASFDTVPLCKQCDGTNAAFYRQMQLQRKEVYEKATGSVAP